MFDVGSCPKIFADKLLKEGSFDGAIKKVVWEAYKQGYEDAKNNIPLYKTKPDAGEWNEVQFDSIITQGEFYE